MPSLLEKFGLSLAVIITRYLMKEVFLALLGVTFVLLLIFLSNQLVRYLSYAAAGKIGAGLVMQLMGFEIPYLLALLLPVGLYIGIVLAYGRLYADSEIPVLNACGVGIKPIIMITSISTLIVAGVVLVLMLWINPLIAAEKDKRLAESSLLDTLTPGRFQVIRGGRSVVYVEQISRNRQKAKNLFIAEQKTKSGAINQPWIVVSAASGYVTTDPRTNENFIVSTEGNRYDGTPGQNEYKIIQFKKYAVRVPSIVPSARQAQEAIPTNQLWHDLKNPVSVAELQWRLSMPLSVLILGLLAVPLSQIRPRQGRYSHLLPAVLIYIIYVNLLFVARNWVELKTVWDFVGMWWVHLLLLGLAIMLLFFQEHYRLRPFFKKSVRQPS